MIHSNFYKEGGVAVECYLPHCAKHFLTIQSVTLLYILLMESEKRSESLSCRFGRENLRMV